MAALATRLSRIERRFHARQWQEQHAKLVYCSPSYFARHKLGFQPDPWQERVLEWQGRRLLLNVTR